MGMLRGIRDRESIAQRVRSRSEMGRAMRFDDVSTTAQHPYVERFVRRCTVTVGSDDVYRRRIKSLITAYRGTRVSVSWPLGYRYVVGRDSYFGVRLDRSDVCGFAELARYDWIVFGGLLCPGYRFPYIDSDVWIILTCSGEVFGYGPCTRLLYRLSGSVKEFTRFGGFYATELYELPHASMAVERDLYGLRLCDEDLVWVLWGVADPQMLLETVSANCGSCFYGVDESYAFTFGTRSYFELDSKYSPCVFTCLQNAGYYVIGLCTLFCRVILLNVEDSGIYVLHGRTVIKAANDVRHFMRLRLRAFLLGCDFCFTVSDVGEGYVPIGSRIDFGCRAIYDDSGDYEIERKWFLHKPIYYIGDA
ncbi:B28.3 [miniopterid betaherpesvirus 1]|uniref:B28.3 n=1 Tax=miniopterid betaherpesvirus 1 TaxID=3070189 RepID=I3VPZ9_9BETA|nr:B28.3 [miniopterid betaherpesvirus 1]AFK83843.1 B28.3 [miniopterid betaherpesvirus 1]